MTSDVFASCKDRSWCITSMMFRLVDVRESQTAAQHRIAIKQTSNFGVVSQFYFMLNA